MYRTQAGLVCHRNPDETVRSVDRSTALRLNTGVHAKHPGQLRFMSIPVGKLLHTSDANSAAPLKIVRFGPEKAHTSN
jgi:hypothetical protein